MNETRAASYGHSLSRRSVWTEGAPAAPVERKAGLEPAVSMAHMGHGERNVQTNNNRKVWMLCAGRVPRRLSRIGGGEDGLGDARLPDGGGAFLHSRAAPKAFYRLYPPDDTAARRGGFIPDEGSYPSGGHGAA